VAHSSYSGVPPLLCRSLPVGLVHTRPCLPVGVMIRHTSHCSCAKAVLQCSDFGLAPAFRCSLCQRGVRDPVQERSIFLRQQSLFIREGSNIAIASQPQAPRSQSHKPVTKPQGTTPHEWQNALQLLPVQHACDRGQASKLLRSCTTIHASLEGLSQLLARCIH
jgi:hypothetical protein